MSTTLGIDQSYSGLAMVAYNSDTHEHADALGAFEADKYHSQGHRLAAAGMWMSTQIKRFEATLGPIDVVAMEGYAAGAKFGREIAGELGAAVKLTLLHELRHPSCCPLVIAPTKLKKYTTGKGTAAKAEMLLAVYKRWGVTYSDDNLADAYSLARAASTWRNQIGTKTEMETLTDMGRYKGERVILR